MNQGERRDLRLQIDCILWYHECRVTLEDSGAIHVRKDDMSFFISDATGHVGLDFYRSVADFENGLQPDRSMEFIDDIPPVSCPRVSRGSSRGFSRSTHRDNEAGCVCRSV